MTARTHAEFACLVCGYSARLVYGSGGVVMCQQCQCAAPAYLIPRCPECGSNIGLEAARAGADRRRYACPACNCTWQEEYALAG